MKDEANGRDNKKSERTSESEREGGSRVNSMQSPAARKDSREREKKGD